MTDEKKDSIPTSEGAEETKAQEKSEAGDSLKNAKTAKAPRLAKAAKQIRNVPIGHAYIQATYNNTIVTVTDLNGSALVWSTAGHLGFKGPKKATPYAASLIVKELAEKLKPYGMRDVHIFVRGVGSGRESAVRAFNANGLNIISIKDETPLPHNGPRQPKPRRI